MDETRRFKFIPQIFLTADELKEIRSVEEMDKDITTDTSLITIQAGEAAQTDDGKDAYGLVDDDGDGIIFTDIKGNGFVGYMITVLDPSRVFVGMPDSYGGVGLTLQELVNKYGAEGGINAGGFKDDGGGGFGGFDFGGGDMGDIFGDIFGDLFGGGGSRRRANNGPMKGANLRAVVHITFEEAVFGCQKELEINLKDTCTTCHGTGAKPGTSPETCSKCNGTGQITYTQQTMFGSVRNVTTCPDCNGTGKIIRDKCTACHGTGYTSSRKRIQVNIPAGIDDGQSIRIREKGEPGVNGGPRGDLLVEVQVTRHPIFQRQDMNIFSTAPITFAQAALGGDVKISTVDGDVLYTVKPGTQTDTKIRLKGKGVPSLRNSNVRGDHYVTLVVQTPTKLNEKAKEALRAFDEACGNRPAAEEKAANGETAEQPKKKKGFMDKVKEAFEDIDK